MMAFVEARLPNPRFIRQRAILFILKSFYGSQNPFRRGYRSMPSVRRHSQLIVPVFDRFPPLLGAAKGLAQLCSTLCCTL
jgi:hypothetical protein